MKQKEFVFVLLLSFIVFSSQTSHLDRVCTPQEVEKMKSLKPTHRQSSCPEQSKWMSQYAKLTHRLHANIVNIGCNKGYEIVSYMRYWSGDKKYSIPRTRQAHVENTPNLHRLSGVCGTGDEMDPDVSIFPKRKVKGYCIEAMKTSVEMLERSFQHLGYSDDLFVIKAAASSSNGTVQFPVANPGIENLGLETWKSHSRPDYNNELDTVPLITLDDFVAKIPTLKVEGVEWLSIDTEGNDPEVLKGAQKSLESHLIKAFEFEYHKVGVWATTSLNDVITHLYGNGYSCYWEMNDGTVMRLTNCFDESYDKEKGWSNVVCAHETSDLASILYEQWEAFMKG